MHIKREPRNGCTPSASCPTPISRRACPSMGWVALVVSIAGVSCFANSYDATFAFDDSEAIIGNKDLNPNLTNISDLFSHDFWGNTLASNLSHKSYRPLTVLTFRLNFWLAGGLHPMGFHVINIILHGVVSALFFVVFTVLVRDSDSQVHLDRETLSLLCSLLFAVHPVHTENVAAVVGRADLLCAICFLLAFILYAEALHCELNIWRGVCFLLVFPLVVCSVLFKEQGITVLGVCAAYDIFMVNRIHPKILLHNLGIVKSLDDSSVNVDDIPPQPRLLPLCKRLLVIVVFGSAILYGRWKIMGSQPPTFQPVDNPQSFINNTFYRVINYNYLYALNAWLLVNPWWLCFDWSMGCVPLIDSLMDFRLLAIVAFHSVLGCLIFVAVSLKPSPEQRYLTMALILLILPFLPASNILFRVGFVIAERNLYLSSAGFVMIVALGIHALHHTWPKMCRILTVYLLVVHFTRSVQRSSQWQNEKILFTSGEKVCPLNAKVHYNIAKLFADEGEVDFAMLKYQLAIRLNPAYDQAMNNLGNLYKDKGRLTEAEAVLQRALQIRSDFSAAWMNLAVVQSALKKYSSSETSFLTALRHRKRYPDCYYNLGNLYLDQGRHEDALMAWGNATLQKPTHLSAWLNTILLLDNLERLNDIRAIIPAALRHNPNEPAIHFNYASALGKAGLFEESEKHFLTAIKYNDRMATYHSNLAVLYHRWGKYDLAEKEYSISLQLEPNNKQTVENLQMLYRKLGKIL